MTRARRAAALAALLLLTAFRPAAAGELLRGLEDPWLLCKGHIEAAERLVGLPKRLLQAIARVESGRWDASRAASFAWPWTVMAEGRGRFLPSRAAAVAEVRALHARGITNIDVGCMQINLAYHGTAFEDLEQAFDPAYNVAYAVRFLLDLRAAEGSWTGAVGRYHSARPERAADYRDRVYTAWRAERKAASGG